MLQAVTSDDINEKLVTLIVGPEEAHFTWLHEILAFHSPFFAGAIKYSCYNESKEHIVYMPEDKPDVVREFIRWVTDHRVGGYGLGSDNPSIDPWAYWDLMTELYIFGNKYNIPRLQNVAINEIITLFRDQYAFPHAITIDKIFEETPVNATFRALVIDMVILTHENPEALIDGQDRMGDGFHPDFIKGLAKRLCQAVRHELSFDAQRLNYKQWGSDYCSYHVSEVAARSNGQRVGPHLSL